MTLTATLEHNETTSVPTAVGELRAGIWIPEAEGPLPGIVLVDGSGDGAFDDWGEWPRRIAGCGAVVLAHDKPGCGSPGDWRDQSFEDRARESLAALRVLRAHPSTARRPVGLMGISQGGWVSMLAASLHEEKVDFIISMSGPGVSVAAQDRMRIEGELVAAGESPEAVAEALAWLDERADRLRTGQDARSVLDAQKAYADRSWYPITVAHFNTVEMLEFIGRILDFDPAVVLPKVGCPVLGVFGGADPIVPVFESIETFARCLPRLPGDPHGLASFPGGNHGLFTADPKPGVSRTSQLASGFLPTVEDFVAAQVARYVTASATRG
jgi:uncharacterized protein